MSEQLNPEQARNAPRKIFGRRPIVTGIFLLPAVAVLFPSCVVLLTGMAPSIVAYIVDRSRGKYLAITVSLLNFCGVLPGLTKLWQEGQAIDSGMRIAGDPLHWLISYGGAGAGWIIYFIVPPLLAIYYSSISNRRVDALKYKQAQLIETWGAEVVPGNLQDLVED